MANCKEQIIKSIGSSLIEDFTEAQIQKITNNIVRALRNYDVSKIDKRISSENLEQNADVLQKFCDCLAISGKSQKTIFQYKRTAEKLAQIVGKNYTDMEVYDIRVFLAEKKESGVSNRTLENQRANLSAFFQWMFREDLIRKNPCMNIDPIKYVDKVRMPFSSVEVDLLRISCKNIRERAMIELLLSSGVRVSELVNIKVHDIDFSESSVHVTKGKGAKERTVYISTLAKRHLQEYLKERTVEGEYLFYNKNKEPLCPGGVRHILNEIAKRAGVENVHPHRFRRTFATSLANRGMDIQEIRKLLGHSDIDTTLEYVYTSDKKTHATYLRYVS